MLSSANLISCSVVIVNPVHCCWEGRFQHALNVLHKYITNDGPCRKHLNVDPIKTQLGCGCIMCRPAVILWGQQEVVHQSYKNIRASKETPRRSYQTALTMALLYCSDHWHGWHVIHAVIRCQKALSRRRWSRIWWMALSHFAPNSVGLFCF